MVPASVFAHLVKMEIMPVNSALTTIIRHLEKGKGKHATAMTMMCKMLDINKTAMHREVQAGNTMQLEEIRALVKTLDPAYYEFDINYTFEYVDFYLHTAQQQAHSQHQQLQQQQQQQQQQAPLEGKAAAAAARRGSVLQAVTTWRGHEGPIWSFGYDEGSSMLVSSGKDGTIILWSADGTKLQDQALPKHALHTVDISPHGMILAAGMAQSAKSSKDARGRISPGPCVMQLPLHDTSCWVAPRIMSHDDTILISGLKAIPSIAEHSFVTSETHHPYNGNKEERVCLYDLARAVGGFEKMQPVATFTDHTEPITCLAPYPANVNLIISGDRGKCGTVRLWDRRLNRAAGIFGSAGPDGMVYAHEKLITTLDANAMGLILTGSSDKMLKRWDIRALQAPVQQVDTDAVMSIALLRNEPYAAVATTSGLHFIDFTTPTPVLKLAQPAAHETEIPAIARYKYIKWAESQQRLFATGAKGVDVYDLK